MTEIIVLPQGHSIFELHLPSGQISKFSFALGSDKRFEKREGCIYTAGQNPKHAARRFAAMINKQTTHDK